MYRLHVCRKACPSHDSFQSLDVHMDLVLDCDGLPMMNTRSKAYAIELLTQTTGKLKLLQGC